VPEHDDIPPVPPAVEQPRHGGNKMFMSAPGQKALDVWAAERWAVNNWDYRQIASAMNCDVGTSWRRVQRGLRIIDAPTLEAAERARAAHRARLEAATEVAMEVMDRDHVHVAHGKVVVDDAGNPVLDDAPKLAAADRIRTLSESLRKLDGLDAPQSVEVSINDLDRQIAEAEQRLAAAAGQTGQASPTEGTED
jgi:hypothetical protein